MNSGNSENVVSISPVKVSCRDCRLRKFCLVADLNAKELGLFERITQHRRLLEKGTQAFRQGDQFDTLYTVRTGSLKTYTLTPDGSEQITGFCLPGDLIGLNAIGSGVHGSSAEALETTTLCSIPFANLSSLHMESIQQRLLILASEQIQNREQHITMLGKESAEQRLASLLVDLADRLKNLGNSTQQINLSMSRADIGNYLSLAIETVSRLFGKLCSIGLINVNRRQLRINNLHNLRCFAELKFSKYAQDQMITDETVPAAQG